MAMPPSAYHHGSLRQALLTEGKALLAEAGAQAVTLRELARRAQVSHAAPQRHFADRDDLLEELAAQGFEELTGALQAAEGPAEFADRFADYAHTHVRFAMENARLMELMFTRDLNPTTGGPAAHAATRFFALGARMLGEADPQQLGSLPFVLAGTLEGISALAASGRLPADRVREVTADAVALLLPAVQDQLEKTANTASQTRPLPAAHSPSAH